MSFLDRYNDASMVLMKSAIAHDAAVDLQDVSSSPEQKTASGELAEGTLRQLAQAAIYYAAEYKRINRDT